MKATNQMRLSFPARSVNESFGRAAVAAFLVAADPTLEELCDVKTAVSEAITNVIVHAYRGGTGTVYISAALYPDGRFSVKIRDTGCGIPDIERAMEPTFTTDPQGERAGLGFAVMSELMDKVRVRSAPGKGTTVLLERRPKLCD